MALWSRRAAELHRPLTCHASGTRPVRRRWRPGTSSLPWFSNSNGPKKRVMWGNPAPYAVVNIITGFWKTETYKVRDRSKLAELMRAPIQQGRWFQQASFCGTRTTARWPEKLLARFTERRVKMRGKRENLFFVDRRKLLKKYTAEERAADTHV